MASMVLKVTVVPELLMAPKVLCCCLSAMLPKAPIVFMVCLLLVVLKVV